MCTQCSLQCLMRLTEIIGPVCRVIKRLISGCAPKMKPSPSIGGMSLGMDQHPTILKQTARPTNSQMEAKGRDTGQTNVKEGGASMRRVGRWRLLILRRLVFVV